MKKNVLGIVMMLMMGAAGTMAQGTFKINGQLKNLSASEVYLVHIQDAKQIIDSAAITNGSYVLTGDLKESGPATLMDVSPFVHGRYSGDVAEIFLTAESFSMTHVDSFANPLIIGSAANTEFNQFLADEKPYQQREMAMMPAYQAARKANDESTAKAIETQAKVIDKGMQDTVSAPFVRQHPQSPVALYVLQGYARNNPDAPALPTLFDGLSPAIKGSAAGKVFAEKLAILAKTSIGSMAMDFTQNDTLGKPVSLSAFRGSYVLIDFWASWCGPCRKENPNVVATYNKYKDKGFRIIGVSLDRPGDKDKWLKAIDADGLAWTQVSDLQFWKNAVAVEYGVGAIPQNFLIDPQGKIVAKGLRGDDLEQKLGEIYKN